MSHRAASAPRSKRDRKREKRREYRLRLRERQERESQARLQQMGEDLRLIEGADTPAEVAAAALRRLFEHHAPAPELTDELFGGSGSERARAVADAALQAGPSMVAFTLNADVALAAGDLDLAEAHLVRARELGEQALVTVRMARVLAARGRVADAVEQLGQALAAEPYHGPAQLFRAELMARLASWEAGPQEDCPCASGHPYDLCCRDAARRLLAEFRDRTPLYDLRQAVMRFVAGRERLDRAVHDSLNEWTDVVPPDETAETADALMLLAIERALTTPLEGDGPTVMDLFARDDEETPELLARLASEWSDSVTFGLWQVTELGEPGVVLTDYLTGVRVYANLPTDLREGLRPWSVQLGCVGQVHGVGQAGPAFCGMSPSEATRLALPLVRFVERMEAHVAPLAGLVGPVDEWAPLVREKLEEGSWLPDRAAPAPPFAVDTTRSVMQRMLPRFVSQLSRMRAAAVGLANADGDGDGDGLEFVEARLELAEPERARLALAEHPDYESGPDGIKWLGREDEPLPALDGLTPREAAERKEYADRLEALTRESEYLHGRRS